MSSLFDDLVPDEVGSSVSGTAASGTAASGTAASGTAADSAFATTVPGFIPVVDTTQRQHYVKLSYTSIIRLSPSQLTDPRPAIEDIILRTFIGKRIPTTPTPLAVLTSQANPKSEQEMAIIRDVVKTTPLFTVRPSNISATGTFTNFEVTVQVLVFTPKVNQVYTVKLDGGGGRDVTANLESIQVYVAMENTSTIDDGTVAKIKLTHVEYSNTGFICIGALETEPPAEAPPVAAPPSLKKVMVKKPTLTSPAAATPAIPVIPAVRAPLASTKVKIVKSK